MHVYMRWYSDNRPITQPERMSSEVAARTAILLRFPRATFGPRTRAVDQPTCDVAGIAEVSYAYAGVAAPGSEPVADILFPAE